MRNLKNDLFRSIACTATFAVVFGWAVSCGNRGQQNNGGSTMGTLVRLAVHFNPNMVTIPAGLSSKPFLATLFQSSQGGSQLQQSFQGVCPFSDYYPLPSSGYIVFSFPDQNNLGGFYTSPQGLDPCSGVFSQIGGGVDQKSGLTLTDPGVPMIFGGTLTTLVATGITNGGQYVRCTDTTTTAPVNDGDKVETYYVLSTNSVVLGIGTTQLPFACNLKLPSGDPIRYLSVQFAKI